MCSSDTATGATYRIQLVAANECDVLYSISVRKAMYLYNIEITVAYHQLSLVCKVPCAEPVPPF